MNHNAACVCVIAMTEHPKLTEFKKKAVFDGKIIIIQDKIIKIKPHEYLTVDLQYDASGGVFLDADKNVYLLKNGNTSSEILNLVKNDYDFRKNYNNVKKRKITRKKK